MTEEVKKEEVKEEKIKEEETPTVDKVDKVDNAKDLSPFVSKDDIIVCKVGYYLKNDGAGFVVEGVQDEFTEALATSSFEVTFRLPSQKDANIIHERTNSSQLNQTEIGMFSAFTKLEYIRLLVLLVAWTLPKPCIEESVEELHPSFVKGIISALRDKIGMDAIV